MGYYVIQDRYKTPIKWFISDKAVQDNEEWTRNIETKSTVCGRYNLNRPFISYWNSNVLKYLQILVCQVNTFFYNREAAKKVFFLIAGPLRPYPPPSSGLMAIELFHSFFNHKIAGNGVWQFFFCPQFLDKNGPIFWKIL